MPLQLNLYFLSRQFMSINAALARVLLNWLVLASMLARFQHFTTSDAAYCVAWHLRCKYVSQLLLAQCLEPL